MSTETNEIEPTESVEMEPLPKTKQEENWLFMTVLQIPWHHANKIDNVADRSFLVDKALEVQKYLQMEQAKQQEAMMAAMAGQTDSGLITPPQPQLVTP